ELYTYVNNSPTPTDDELRQIIESSDIVRVEDTDSELLLDHNEPDNIQSSVDLEDSEAVLLASNLDDSIYKLETTAKIADEMYAIEQSEHSELAHSSHSDEDEPEMVQSVDAVQSDSMSRSYVVSPSVFVVEPVPECVEHIRPVSQAAAVAEPKEDEEADNTPDAVTNTAEDKNDTPTEVTVAIDEANNAPAEVTNMADENDTSEAVTINAVEAIEAAAQSMTDSFIHVSKFLDDEKDKAVDIMTNREGSEQVERAVSEVMDNSKDAVNKVSDNTKDAANKASDKARDAGNKASDKIRDAGDKAENTAKEAADSTKDAADSASAKARDMGDKAKDAVDSASAKARDVGDRAKKATADASSRAKDMLDDAGKSVKKAASDANTKAQSAFSKACESGEKLAKRAMDEASEAEKALEREARETSPTVLRTLGVVAGALAVVSGYYFRLPGRDNQRFGFAGGVASAVIGLGTLATAFIKKNA
ncbi:hypothetical protein IW136_003767, partial [Coemansia sp. RSA 678]